MTKIYCSGRGFCPGLKPRPPPLFGVIILFQSSKRAKKRRKHVKSELKHVESELFFQIPFFNSNFKPNLRIITKQYG
jgi:hypothetical protein